MHLTGQTQFFLHCQRDPDSLPFGSLRTMHYIDLNDMGNLNGYGKPVA